MAIVGGGNSALEEALYLSSITNKVYLIHRRNEFRGNAQYVDMVKNNDKIEILTPYIIKSLHGDSSLEGLTLLNVETNEEKYLEVKALFEYVGAKPNTECIKFDDVKDDKGYIIVNIDMSTKVKGFFAGGDVTNKKLRQIAVAIGDGANASDSIISYLRDLR